MKIAREKLLSALTAVQPGLASKEIIEQTQSFIFRDGHVTTYNDEVSVRHPVELDISGAVKAEELHTLLKRTAADTLDITIKDDKELVVRTPNSEAGIVLEAEIRAPLDVVQAPEPSDKGWQSLPSNFLDALRFCATTVATDMSRQILTCVHLHEDRAESTDTFRITSFTLAGEVPEPMLVPGAVIKFLQQYKFLGYMHRNEWLHFTTAEGAVFSCRTLAGQFPNLSRFLDMKGRAFKFPEGLDAVVQRAVVFTASQDFQADQYIEIAVKPGMLRVASKGSHGHFKELVKLPDYKGEEFKFSIHPEFLSAAYSMLRTCEVSDSQLKLVGTNFTHLLNLVVG